MESLGSRIKRLRLRAKLNKAALAREVGVSDVTISYWESGAIKQIGHERLVALAEALECPLSTLLEENPSASLLILTHDKPVEWRQTQAVLPFPPTHLELSMPWSSECYLATPGPDTDLPPLKPRDMGLFGPTAEFKQTGYYLVETEQQLALRHLETAPDNDQIVAVLLAAWQQQPLH
ncbi:helix-turn-helix transcriptional regulator [Halomonas sp. Bachu 37]|uniref:helix-turn-helix domain-containing protein n=1 Tax=Halomonas kashgarensis TaxID=3084920 RepID=UPI003217E077